MASPQLENGYTRIANELLEACYKKITYSNWLRIALHTIRITYGFHVKTTKTGFKSYMDKLGIDESAVATDILDMSGRNILTIKHISEKSFWVGINKNHESWRLN